MKQVICLLLILFSASVFQAQIEKFRNGTFLHHSTGQNIWGPNGSATSIPDEVSRFNSEHGLTGNNSFFLTENWYPSGDNEWYTWDRIFQNDPYFDDIQQIISENEIIIIKSCFPSSNVEAWGEAADTLYPDYKTVYNYKWHWRNIINKMKNLPHNFFAVWTNAPLVESATDANQAHLSDSFCRWAKDTLANGFDNIFGEFPKNVYVFDFFHKLADAAGFLPLQYSNDEWDSHPNAAATQLAAPQFADEILGAILQYEEYLSHVDIDVKVPGEFWLYQNYPNPFNPATVISWRLEESGNVQLKVYNVLGREAALIIDEFQKAGSHKIVFNASDYLLNSGVYLFRLTSGKKNYCRKMIYLK